ncbi:DUF4230 domain-containing protein [Fibrobacter sp. UWB11]|uniref:DUF4230 domain-containing protein n=1 Tax=Fibrobacter sp. UWB11 TaxID=1896202 RepID=UPI000926060E|nr:DUF4230 domain-containing protein [Fibrobacter sp. UWB11]SIN91730.1 Protein of unknown function [Fibrobacter sp. UWB11]
MDTQLWKQVTNCLTKKKVIVVVIVFVLFVGLFFATKSVVKMLLPSDSRKTQITSEFVSSQINGISELATLHHHYRKVANYQDAKKLLVYMPDWRINKSIKEFSLIYQGDVKMGYDLTNVKIEVDSVTRTIFIHLPEPKILSHSIDFESIQVLWERQGWFNDIKFEDFKQFFISEQKKYEKENYDELKRLASERAQKIIRLNLGSNIKLVESPESDEKSFIDRWIRPEDGYRIKMP